MEKQEMCKNCGNKLVVRATRKSASQLKKPYYYTAYYFCPHCKKLYHDEKFKAVNQQLTLSSWSGNDHDRISDGDSIAPLQNDENTVDIWTDGACVHNGTPRARAAWSFVSVHSTSSGSTRETERAGLVEGKQTNNVAEGLAIYHALKWAAEQGFKKIKLHTDSQISLFNLNKPARLVKVNREIFEAIEEVIYRNKLEVVYVKVLGHSGDINNERADRLANKTAVSG